MIDRLKKEYMEWAQKQIKLDQYDDFIEITTPYVDMNHDFISLFLSKQGDHYRLTDDGYIMDELSTLGIDIEKSEKRNHFFRRTLNIFGVSYNSSTFELYVTFHSIKEYPEMQQRLIQCLIRVSDMLLTSRNRVISFFIEEVSEFFLDREVPFNDSVSYIGKTGRSQTFDFALPKSKKCAPKLIKAVNNPTSDAYREPLFAFMDVQESKKDHQFLVLANDTNSKMSDRFTEPFQNYNIHVLEWSKRDTWIKTLKSS